MSNSRRLFSGELIREIDTSDVKHVRRSPKNRTFDLSLSPALVSDLSGWIGTLIVRAILYELDIDEHRIFKWRPENKYVQFLILNHYARGCMPDTVSFTLVMKEGDWVQRIRKLISSGYFIKATLGFGSRNDMSFDRTFELERILNEGRVDSLLNEKWVFQKRLKIRKEFRVHSFGKDVIYGLTLRMSGKSEHNDFDLPQQFVRSVLQKLPLSILEGTLIGWDIALTDRNKYYVIEANFSGYHPEYCAGFQTTGYVEDPMFGPVICAWLHTYFKNRYALSIRKFESVLMEKFPYLEEFSYCISLFDIEHVEELFRACGRVRGAYIYLNDGTDSRIIKLVSYLQIANFADTIYIITIDALQDKAKALFSGDNVIHLSAESLLREDEGMEVLRFEAKRICYEHAVKMKEEQSFLFIQDRAMVCS